MCEIADGPVSPRGPSYLGVALCPTLLLHTTKRKLRAASKLISGRRLLHAFLKAEIESEHLLLPLVHTFKRFFDGLETVGIY